MKTFRLFAATLLLAVTATAAFAEIGFRPATGSPVHWVWPGGRAAGITVFTDTGDTFPNTPETFAARYGAPPVLADGSNVRAIFTVDADTWPILGRALEIAAQDPQNPWGLKPGVPTPLEISDWAATMESRGWAGSLLRQRYLPDSLPPVKPPVKPPVPPPVVCPECQDCPPPPVCPVPPPSVPTSLARRLAGVGAWNVVNAEGRDALGQLKLWSLSSGIAVPEDVSRTMSDATAWAVVPPVGGRRARLRRLESWLIAQEGEP